MTVDNHSLYFTYDAAGVPLSLTYDGGTYYYVTNLQGDVVAILDSTGTEVVRYSYDAWGNLITDVAEGTLGFYNPLRYRGYVYDEETKLYYLQSRYYNPEMGRFINGDNQMSGVGGDALGYNMFAYCFNNPVNMSDSSGNWPKWLETAANWVNKNIIQPATGFVEKTIDYLTPPSKEDHYNRNQNNIQFPEEYDETFFKEWDDGVSANCHQFTAPNRDNVKYVSPDGKYEAIYDVNNKLVTDPRDVGTYNFVSPNEDPLGHFIKDVIPWIQFGNSPDDSTEWRQRALSFISIYE